MTDLPMDNTEAPQPLLPPVLMVKTESCHETNVGVTGGSDGYIFNSIWYDKIRQN